MWNFLDRKSLAVKIDIFKNLFDDVILTFNDQIKKIVIKSHYQIELNQKSLNQNAHGTLKLRLSVDCPKIEFFE